MPVGRLISMAVRCLLFRAFRRVPFEFLYQFFPGVLFGASQNFPPLPTPPGVGVFTQTRPGQGELPDQQWLDGMLPSVQFPPVAVFPTAWHALPATFPTL